MPKGLFLIFMLLLSLTGPRLKTGPLSNGPRVQPSPVRRFKH